MKKISLIGCGRWGTFLGWYAGNYCGFDQVDMYDIPTSPNFIELRDTRKNPYLSLSDNMILHDKIEDMLKMTSSLSPSAVSIFVRCAGN